MELTSPVFTADEYMPEKYGCHGENINPPLRIEDVPEGTRSLALIVEDPDAPHGTFTHWVIWNINPGTHEIDENRVPGGAEQGLNDFKKTGYGGPCPPSGTHRYVFQLYALDTTLHLGKKAHVDDLVQAMEGHILEQTELVGLYSR